MYFFIFCIYISIVNVFDLIIISIVIDLNFNCMVVIYQFFVNYIVRGRSYYLVLFYFFGYNCFLYFGSSMIVNYCLVYVLYWCGIRVFSDKCERYKFD